MASTSKMMASVSTGMAVVSRSFVKSRPKLQRNESGFNIQNEETLLDIIEDKNKGTAIVHRVYIVSTLAHQNLAEIGKYFTKYFKELHARLRTPSITGLLLIYPSNCVHVVESETRCLLELLNMMKNDEEGPQELVKQSKVLLMSHTVGRLYRQYNYRIVDHDSLSWSTDETYFQVLMEIVMQLQKLGQYITTNSKLKQMSFRTIMDTMHYRVPELLPDQGAIAYLLDTDDDCVMTVGKWIKRFYQLPFDVDLGTDGQALLI